MKIWNKEVFITKEGLDCPSEYIMVRYSVPEGKFPNWRTVIPPLGAKRDAIHRIGINPQLLKHISEALPSSSVKEVDMYFSAEIQGIVVFNKDDRFKSYGVLMPSTVSRPVNYMIDGKFNFTES